MTADALKSTSITNSDAVPIVANNIGKGAPGIVKDVSDFVTPTAAGLADTSSKYKMIRLPSNCILKALKLTTLTQLDSSGSAALTVDVGAYYSDSTTDGTSPAHQGTAIDVDFFLANTAFAHSSGGQEIDALASFPIADRFKQLWDALGLTSDPGGFIDVVMAVHTAAATAGTGDVAARAEIIL